MLLYTNHMTLSGVNAMVMLAMATLFLFLAVIFFFRCFGCTFVISFSFTCWQVFVTRLLECLPELVHWSVSAEICPPQLTLLRITIKCGQLYPLLTCWIRHHALNPTSVLRVLLALCSLSLHSTRSVTMSTQLFDSVTIPYHYVVDNPSRISTSRPLALSRDIDVSVGR